MSYPNSDCYQLACLASNIFSFHWLMTHPNRINESFGWHFQYLTIIGLSLTTLTFSIGLLADISLSPALFRIKNSLSVASAPMELLITLLYWGLRAIDPALVLPPDLPQLPLAADMSFHLFPVLGLLADLLLFSPPYAIATIPAFGLSAGIALVYYAWVELCFANNGFYPYPIFDEAGLQGRVILFAGSAVVMGVATALLKSVYGAVNGWDVDGDASHPATRESRKAR
ncbi:hypothetical protein ANO11243_014340 [Dothideomycetidae sp. 11243]|nr:hypothetical protein ANO11243_014340 [fungal sp. No.11243]